MFWSCFDHPKEGKKNSSLDWQTAHIDKKNWSLPLDKLCCQHGRPSARTIDSQRPCKNSARLLVKFNLKGDKHSTFLDLTLFTLNLEYEEESSLVHDAAFTPRINALPAEGKDRCLSIFCLLVNKRPMSPNCMKNRELAWIWHLLSSNVISPA